MPLQHILLPILVGLHLLIAGILVTDLLRQHRTPAATLAWMMCLLLLPGVGILLYVLGGAPRKRGSRLAEFLRSHVHESPGAAARFCPDTERLLRALGLPGATVGNRVRLCSDNEDAASALFALIHSAQRRIFLSVFSFEADAIGRRLIDAMRERALAGVQVRMLVDGYGSLNLASPPLLELQAAGGRIARFRPLVASGTLRGAFNYRNHRKMVVADGRAAWIGGRNVAQKYLSNFADGSHWVDLSLLVEGPAAAVFETVCRSDWLAASGESVPDEVAAPADAGAGGSCVQVLASGPDLPDDTLHAMLLAGIMGARHRVWIVSPFFVPDDALQSALHLACRRGLDVRIVVPRRSNQRQADWVRTSYLRELGAAGGRIFMYGPAVLHAKIVILDDRVALAGSANFDMRSLFINHEVAAVLYDLADVESVAALAAQYMAAASEDVRPVGFARTALGGALRIIAPLM
ncbi:MAG TPA: phospholipase D-like domain-containing protein [Steroidobacteraceae bacterium]